QEALWKTTMVTGLGSPGKIASVVRFPAGPETTIADGSHRARRPVEGLKIGQMRVRILWAIIGDHS
ncbi:MAG TPA: hypothetical protein P5244_14600, partial [Syntrophales bacterium]|nr:hypothetical protein [Syntrophales bacterium]